MFDIVLVCLVWMTLKSKSWAKKITRSLWKQTEWRHSLAELEVAKGRWGHPWIAEKGMQQVRERIIFWQHNKHRLFFFVDVTAQHECELSSREAQNQNKPVVVIADSFNYRHRRTRRPTFCVWIRQKLFEVLHQIMICHLSTVLQHKISNFFQR